MEICRARLTNCPGTLTKLSECYVKQVSFKKFLNLLVSVVSLMLAGKEFQAAGQLHISNTKHSIFVVNQTYAMQVFLCSMGGSL